MRRGNFARSVSSLVVASLSNAALLAIPTFLCRCHVAVWIPSFIIEFQLQR